MTETIDTPDGTIHVTESLGDTELYATGLTVSQTEKVNLGNYENREVYANLRVEINPALAMNHETERDVAKLLEYAHAEVEKHIAVQVADAKEPDGEWE